MPLDDRVLEMAENMAELRLLDEEIGLRRGREAIACIAAPDGAYLLAPAVGRRAVMPHALQCARVIGT